MLRSIDPESPIPLYHQIAEAIRYQIATGAIRPGAVLPPLRDAAKMWGANLHTVRRAYAELAANHIVSTRVPHGTVVLAPTTPATGTARRRPALDRFLKQIVEKARDAHGMGIDELIRLLETRNTALSKQSAPDVYVTECSETQSRDLAAQLAARWRIEAIPWPLGRPEPPAGGRIVATYFHYRDIAHQWPHRLPEVRFMAIRPDPALADILRRRFAKPGKRTSLVLCERETSMLSNITADLAEVLPPDYFRIEPQKVANPSRWLARQRGRRPVLFSPRLWGELDEAARSDRRVVEVRYVFDTRELNEIGPILGWSQS
jgi:DNA-binding transcriptional regulator YhcF (GntR family)